MGRNQRLKKSESCKSSAEGSQKSSFRFLIVSALSAFILSSCQSKDHYVPTATRNVVGNDQSLMTKLGNNDSAAFAFTVNKILFLGSQKPLHRQAQVYEMDLATKQEKRLIFQSGKVFTPIYDEQEKNIYFLSTTDEEKEFPQVLDPKKYESIWPQTEVYRFNIREQETTRLTQYDGFDGSLSIGNGKLYALREKHPGLELWQILPHAERLLNITPQTTKINAPIETIQYSPLNKKWYALAKSELFETADLRKGFTPVQNILGEKEKLIGFQVRKTGVLIHWVAEDGKAVVSLLKGNCLENLWSTDKALILSYDFQPEGNKVLLGLEHDKIRELYITDKQSLESQYACKNPNTTTP